MCPGVRAISAALYAVRQNVRRHGACSAALALVDVAPDFFSDGRSVAHIVHLFTRFQNTHLTWYNDCGGVRKLLRCALVCRRRWGMKVGILSVVFVEVPPKGLVTDRTGYLSS